MYFFTFKKTPDNQSLPLCSFSLTPLSMLIFWERKKKLEVRGVGNLTHFATQEEKIKLK